MRFKHYQRIAYTGRMDVQDKLRRPMRDLRISVTDRCNFRCTYCMPFDEYDWIERNQVLSFEEIARLTGIFAGLGVKKIRLTGGEPLVRRNLDRLIRLIKPENAISYATLGRSKHFAALSVELR